MPNFRKQKKYDMHYLQRKSLVRKTAVPFSYLRSLSRITKAVKLHVLLKCCSLIDLLTDFNGMSTCPGLFYSYFIGL